MNTGSPLWHPAIQCLAYSQNVAGLWLKYGAKTPNIWTSLRRKILPHRATICWRRALTGPIGWAYNPATERGDALAPRPRHLFVPVKLLTMMSESTAGANRLSFAVEWDLPELPAMGDGVPGIPGCLTSEDEERETWTAESLRVSITWIRKYWSVEAGRKTSAVHVYIGYTMIS